MMLWQDPELDDEEQFEELEMKFLGKHTLDELEQIARETEDEFCFYKEGGVK